METFEQKYNAALTWMREIYPTLKGAYKEDAEHYFPELKESEDERVRKELLKEIEFISPRDGETDGEGLILPSYHARIDRYKSYLERQKEQKPAEWSGEDEKMLEKCVGYMTKIIPIPDKDCFVRFETVKDEKCIKWLKSLRPQPHWKPSEEQMDALDNARFCKSYDRSELDLLYEQLKKL